MYDPKDDGITHINIYSKGNTLLGRFLSNFHRSEINTPLGKFQSIEGLIYYMGSFDEKLRTLSGHQAKDAGKLLDRQIRLPEDIFKRIIKESMWRKLTSDGQMVGMLKSSTLPLTHYYVYGNKVINVEGWDWQIQEWETIRKDLQNGQIGKRLTSWFARS